MSKSTQKKALQIVENANTYLWELSKYLLEEGAQSWYKNEISDEEMSEILLLQQEIYNLQNKNKKTP